MENFIFCAVHHWKTIFSILSSRHLFAHLHLRQRYSGVFIFNFVILTLFLTCYFRLGRAVKYMFKVNKRNTRTRSEICSKLTIKTPERRLNLFHL